MSEEAEERSDNVIAITKWANRADSWMNTVTGQGVFGRDKTRHDFFSRPRNFTQIQLEDLYRGDALAARIVDVLPNDMIRAWFEINISTMFEGPDDDPDNVDPEEANLASAGLQQRLRDLDAKAKLKRGLRWDRLYGGALVVMVIDDGREMSEPVDTANIKGIPALRVLHRFQVTEGPMETDPASEHFGSPAFYTISFTSTADETAQVIHADRVLRFQDVDIPDDARSRQADHFGDSVFIRAWEALSDFQMAYRAVANLMSDFAQAVWGIPNLHEMLIAKKEELIQRRIGLQDFVRSTANAVLIDSELGETFTRTATPVGGLAELLDRLGIRLSAATGMPITLLLGIGPKGFATDDASGQANWDDAVASKQDDNLRSQLRRLLRYLMLEQGSATKGREPATWAIEFNPLTQQTSEQRATMEKTVAEKDAIYIDVGVLKPSEVRSSRFTSDGFSMDTQLSQELTDAMIEKELRPPPTPPPPMMIMGAAAPPGQPPAVGIEGGALPDDEGGSSHGSGHEEDDDEE